MSRVPQQAKAKPLPPSTNVPTRPNVNPVYQSQKFHDRQMPRSAVLNTVQPQSPILAKGGPRSSTSTTESVKTVMSPILLPRNLDKKKLEQLVKAAYQDDGDSVQVHLFVQCKILIL